MGILSWLFPSDEDKLAKATRYLERGEFVLARDTVSSVQDGRADEVRAKAREGLKRLNIEVAVGYARAGEDMKAQEHMELAESFGDPSDPELRGARRALREARAEARDARKKPSGLGQAGGAFGGALGDGGALVGFGDGGPVAAEGDDPIFSLPPSDPRVRFAMQMESYPPELRQRLVDLGPEMATAVLAIDEGNAAHAVEVLGQFVEQDSAARFERARAALAAGRLPLAASDLRAFAEDFGHQEIANQHTGAMLAQALAGQRKLDAALEVLDACLAEEPKNLQLGGLKAHVLEAQDKLAEADELARALIKHSSRQMGLYKLMARVRLKAGKRVEAAQALETALTTNCTSGKCGSLPFDVEAGRMLAQIYLEDRMEPRRAAELIGRIKSNLQEPGWFEGYLDALAARNESSPELNGMVLGLAAGLSQGDPRRRMLGEAFPSVG
ncbi:MAG: hypothetical protein H6741_35720 [Alphaproteobacteria bacterium]|nr:hypothetical protein [Alphaproteobacteria bacterium]MCB9798058.1 hypothetical protein [Alphaproteobacteria bacterium]